MGVLDGYPKDEPMHYGEIFNVWAFSAKKKGIRSVYQAYMYHAGDHELQRLVDNLHRQAETEVKECDTILLHNGFVPSPDLPERPPAQWDEIPVGARFTDHEIAALVAQDISTGLVLCSQIIGMSIRVDIAALFSKYYALHLASASAMLTLMKEKGWLPLPPLQLQRPEH
ncbi:hypothetical protein FHS18_003173 [Paenibacillus phyllosphaerae]|uniref:DUF3231 family protein n=1 Tax=Paenibacillus phyllosphaerae TaxID=274593 RepID=A0A7W5AYG8_9BACL|nr:DUF3231 family protein [Paenibacillus phyllosphaerae]MBB3111105.1 hypothetical protein [Paenibacillus phyllosphaerae]